MMLKGSRVKVSAANCNITMRDSKCWFDMNKQIREYKLQMEIPFERAIAFALLRYVAFHPTCVFKYFDYEKGVCAYVCMYI